MLQSMGSQRVGHDWVTKLTFHFICVHSANILKVPTTCQTVPDDGTSEQKNNNTARARKIDGETMKTVTDLIFLGSKITADGDCSHEIKKTLAPWKKRYDRPREHIKKQRHYFAKVRLVKAMVFPVVMYGCDS